MKKYLPAVVFIAAAIMLCVSVAALTPAWGFGCWFTKCAS